MAHPHNEILCSCLKKMLTEKGASTTVDLKKQNPVVSLATNENIQFQVGNSENVFSNGL